MNILQRVMKTNEIISIKTKIHIERNHLTQIISWYGISQELKEFKHNNINPALHKHSQKQKALKNIK